MNDYLEQLIEFRQTHELIECYHCGRPIIPGNRIWVRKLQVYCSLDCACAHALGIASLDFKADGDGENLEYQSFFRGKPFCKA